VPGHKRANLSCEPTQFSGHPEAQNCFAFCEPTSERHFGVEAYELRFAIVQRKRAPFAFQSIWSDSVGNAEVEGISSAARLFAKPTMICSSIRSASSKMRGK
jgi:hypothetical protein